MVKQVRDLPEKDAAATMGVKLRAAREEVGKSRAAVQKETGISAKALEHYEAGTSEISISRLEQLCGLYGQEMKDILAIDAGGRPGELASNENVDAGALPVIEAMLAELVGFREAGFEGSHRRAMALVADLAVAMKRLESDELETLAETRELFEGDRPTADGIFGLFVEDVDEAQRFCGLVEERIVDTAILGTDLYAIEREALVAVADDIKAEFKIEEPEYFNIFDGWGEHGDFVPLIREPLRKLALMGKGVDFNNLKQFPRRNLKTAA